MIFRVDRAKAAAAHALAALLLIGLPAAASPGGDALAVALRALGRGDGIAAQAALERALTEGVPRADLAAYMGEAELLQGDLAAARRWLEAGAFSASTRLRGFQMLGRLEMAQDNPDAALVAFERALDQGPGTAGLWVDIARLHYLSGRHLRALAAAQTALARDPEDPRAIEFKALLVRDSEGPEAALPWFRRGLAAAPEDLSLLGEYAATLGELGRAGEMLAVARRMIELDPDHPRAFYLQAVLAARAGMDGLARRLLARAGNALRGMPAALMLEGILELRAGNSGLAVEALAELARLQPDNRRAQELFARALLENGEAREVIARFASPAGRAGASAYLLTLVGRAYEELGDRAAAADYLDRAAQWREWGVLPLANDGQRELLVFRFGNDPARLDAGIARIRGLIGEGRLAEAGEALESLRARHADSADFITLAGDVALAGGDAAGALKEYRAAAGVRQSLVLTAKMAQALARLGRRDEARALVLSYLARHPLDRDAAWLAAVLASEAGDWRQVRALTAHIRVLEPDARDPAVLALLALAQLRLGEARAALGNALGAYRMQPSSGHAAAVLALAMRQSGSGDAATMAALEAKARQARAAVDPG